MEKGRSYFQVIEGIASLSAGADAGGGAPGFSRGPGGGGSSYLEQDGNSVTGQRVEVRSCGCRSWFCKQCCLPLGLSLKRRMKAEVEKFAGRMLLTFTLDQQLFASPQEAYEYVRSNRCLSVTIQRLHRANVLHSRRYVAVVEWQQNGWPHWHVLVDASFIPFDALCEAWNRNWPEWRERVAAGRPGFGSVRFSVSRFPEAGKAVGYVTAYLTKVPEYGFPDWVIGSLGGYVHRYSTSRGFWTETAGDEDVEATEEGTTEEIAAETQAEEEKVADSKRDRRTIREQLASCGTSCVVLRVTERVDPETGEVVEQREFLAEFPVDIYEAVVVLGSAGVNKACTAATYDDEGRVLRVLRAYVVDRAFGGSEQRS